MNKTYEVVEPTRAKVDALPGPVMIEFGNAWCGHCRAAQPLIAAAMGKYPRMQHLKIADGPGLPLGRSFRVKLWPTLIFLDGGKEKSRLVRPTSSDVINKHFMAIDPM